MRLAYLPTFSFVLYGTCGGNIPFVPWYGNSIAPQIYIAVGLEGPSFDKIWVVPRVTASTLVFLGSGIPDLNLHLPLLPVIKTAKPWKNPLLKILGNTIKICWDFCWPAMLLYRSISCIISASRKGQFVILSISMSTACRLLYRCASLFTWHIAQFYAIFIQNLAGSMQIPPASIKAVMWTKHQTYTETVEFRIFNCSILVVCQTLKSPGFQYRYHQHTLPVTRRASSKHNWGPIGAAWNGTRDSRAVGQYDSHDGSMGIYLHTWMVDFLW